MVYDGDGWTNGWLDGWMDRGMGTDMGMDGWTAEVWLAAGVGRVSRWSGWSRGGGNGERSGAKEGLARGEEASFFVLFLDLEGLLYCSFHF